MDAVTTGIYNNSMGYSALSALTTGNDNTGIGNQSLEAVTTSSENTALGAHAGDSITTGSNNTCIGFEADASSATADNEITLGNSSVTKLRVPGLNSFEINDSGQFSGVASTASGTAGVRKITASTSAPSGGSDGDLWVVYS